MAYLIFIAVTLALLGGFFALTGYETGRGARFWADRRERLDKQVDRVAFIFEHVDLGAFLRDEVRTFAGRLSHDIAHLSLQGVRAAERLLTRLVRYLRAQHVVAAVPRGNVREFVKTLADFKVQLKATHPEVSEIQ